MRSLRTSAPDPLPARLRLGIQARKSMAIACGLAWLVAGFSLADAHVLRLPSYLVGVLGGFAVLAFGPLWMGRRFVLDHRDLDDEALAAMTARSRRAGSLVLLAALIAFGVWLAYFSAGVPPWAL